MKITTRCGENAVAGLNEALLAKAAAAKLLRTDKVRADTTVVEAAVAYPTDSGLLAKAIGSMARTVARIKAAGGATRTRSRDRRRSAGQRARSIAAKLKLRGEQQRDAAQSAVRRITGELAAISEAAMREATAVVRNARRALRTATGQRKGRLHRAINDLETLVGHAERVVAQSWREVLRVEQVGVNDNFFEAGGTSLRLVEVNSKLREAFKRSIPIVEMFRYPTIRELARFLDAPAEIKPAGRQTQERASRRAGAASQRREFAQAKQQKKRSAHEAGSMS